MLTRPSPALEAHGGHLDTCASDVCSAGDSRYCTQSGLLLKQRSEIKCIREATAAVRGTAAGICLSTVTSPPNNSNPGHTDGMVPLKLEQADEPQLTTYNTSKAPTHLQTVEECVLPGGCNCCCSQHCPDFTWRAAHRPAAYAHQYSEHEMTWEIPPHAEAHSGPHPINLVDHVAMSSPDA